MKQNNFILKHSSEILKKFLENKETRNKKFNGKVQLFINPAIGEEFCPHLDMLVKRCQHFAESSFMTSANGKKEIAISLNFSH